MKAHAPAMARARFPLPWVERAARPSFPAARRKHFAQRTRTVNRAGAAATAADAPDAGRVGPRAGRPFHPMRAPLHPRPCHLPKFTADSHSMPLRLPRRHPRSSGELRYDRPHHPPSPRKNTPSQINEILREPDDKHVAPHRDSARNGNWQSPKSRSPSTQI